MVLDATLAAVDTGSGPEHRADAAHTGVASRHRPVAVLQDGSRVACKLLVGADGVRSAVGKHLGVSQLSFVGQAGYRGIAKFDGRAPVADRTVCQVWDEIFVMRVLSTAAALLRTLCGGC